MTTDARVVFDAVNELHADTEFARRLDVGSGSKALVDYLTRRGVGAIEAELLALAYFAGRIHAGERFDLLLAQIEAKS